MTALQFGTTAPLTRVASSTRLHQTRLRQTRLHATRPNETRLNETRSHESRSHGGRLHLTRRGRLVVAVVVSFPLIAALAVFAVLGGSSAIATGDSSTATYSYVTVQPGESLWAIAQKLDPKADPRDVIAEIVGLNQLHSSDVQSGQRLALPSEYSK